MFFCFCFFINVCEYLSVRNFRRPIWTVKTVVSLSICCSLPLCCSSDIESTFRLLFTYFSILLTSLDVVNGQNGLDMIGIGDILD